MSARAAVRAAAPEVRGANGTMLRGANGTMLRVTAVAEVSPARYTVPGWRVTDIEATVRGLAAKGVAFTTYPGMDQDHDGIWTTAGGGKVAWFADPDGSTLSLTQFL